MKRLSICLLVSCLGFCSQARGQSGIITTVAGSGTPGFSGDGGPATSASLNLSSSSEGSNLAEVAVDASGNLFITDPNNSRVRKVSAGGIITTVAGNGTSGSSGDGGPATLAQLSCPTGIAVDASGDLFIADICNSAIRKVSARGIITTVAGNGINGFSGDGGPATSASLWGPHGVVVDNSGNLFIADASNNRIRKVSAGGIITTVAGNGNVAFSGDGGSATSTSLDGPSGVAVDASGNLLIADCSSNRIRKVSASGIITTVAGNGNGGFSGDGGPATTASLNEPTDVAVGASGNLFVADTANNVIREVSISAIADVIENLLLTGTATCTESFDAFCTSFGTGLITGTYSLDVTAQAIVGAWSFSTPYGVVSSSNPGANAYVFSAGGYIGAYFGVTSSTVLEFVEFTFPGSDLQEIGAVLPGSHVCINIPGGKGGESACDPNTAITGTTALATGNPASQTITFGALGNVTLGAAPFAISATASSGLPVSFAMTTASVCTVSGNTVTIVAVGTCSITASQAGNANYAAATPVTESFTVNPAAGASLTWTLHNATFDDGGTATGYFVFDADADTVSNWNIVASAGSILAAFTYTPANSTVGVTPSSGCPAPCISFRSNATFPNGLAPPYNFNENRFLLLSFVAPLTDSGGTVNINLSASTECLNCDPYRVFTQGFVQAATTSTTPSAPLVTYYFPHLALGSGFQTTLTYVNYSPETVSCQTRFYSDSGAPLPVSFAGGAVASRLDTFGPGGSIHLQTQAATNATALTGWAEAQCSGPVKASLLYRLYGGNVAQGEASVNGTTTPAAEFVTFAQTATGIAYANPSAMPATVTITALDATGVQLGSTTLTLQPNAHGAANIGPLLGLSSFTGSVQITSTVPIISLSLNAEAFPVFSSLPPGDLPSGTPLPGGGTTSTSPVATTYYFPHLAVGSGFQTTLTYVNYSSGTVSCQTMFYSDSGGPMSVPFAAGSAVSSRMDTFGPGASIHVQTQADAGATALTGWAEAQCTGPVKASLLYRLYNGEVAQGEASVNATTAPATEFVTFAETATGIAYANPSGAPATVTITALDATGVQSGSTTLTLQPNAHGAANLGPLLGLSSFTGSVQITSTVPIISLSLNAEAFPVFSSLPPGDLPSGTALAWGNTGVNTGTQVQSLTLSPNSVGSGGTVTGTVVLSTAAPLGGALVVLSSGSSAASVPATVTVPAGAGSTTFTVSAGTVSSNQVVTITASYGGTSAQASLTVTPPVISTPQVYSVILSPSSVVSGSTATGTVTLSAAAPPGGSLISLSSNSSLVTVPASVTVPAGATSAMFTVSIGTITASRLVTITASYAGTFAQGVLAVLPAATTGIVCQPISAGPYQFQVWNNLSTDILVYFGNVVLPGGEQGSLSFGAQMNPNECDIIGLPEIAAYSVAVSRYPNGTVVNNSLTFTNTTSGFVFNGRSAYTLIVTQGSCSASADQGMTFEGKSVYSLCLP